MNIDRFGRLLAKLFISKSLIESVLDLLFGIVALTFASFATGDSSGARPYAIGISLAVGIILFVRAGLGSFLRFWRNPKN